MGNGKDIWFVDDDEIFRFTVERMMQDSSYAGRVDYFDDGDRAILRFLRIKKEGGREPSVIFLDLNMSNLEGRRLLDLLNEYESEVKVVIVTSSGNARDRQRAEHEPLVVDYLTKPIDKERIEGVLQSALT